MRGWQSIRDPRWTKWASGTCSTTNKVNANREATLKVKAPAALAALWKTTLFWKQQGAMKATGGDAFVFHHSVVLCSTASISILPEEELILMPTVVR